LLSLQGSGTQGASKVRALLSLNVFHPWLLLPRRSANHISHGEKFDNPLSLIDVAQSSASKRPAGTEEISQSKTAPAVAGPWVTQPTRVRAPEWRRKSHQGWRATHRVGRGVLTAPRFIWIRLSSILRFPVTAHGALKHFSPNKRSYVKIRENFPVH
jgi:hypothetical protein